VLEPHDRRLLLECLRPPEGNQLSFALGTTFTLDLLSLLVCPLSFALFDAWGDEERPGGDPQALLEAVRRYAGRMAVFCQTGQISIPAPGQTLFGYLETSVFEVAPKSRGHVFHPKIWLLRFESSTRDVTYRLLCLSRNLTFDRCWDTAVVLEGSLRDGEVALPANEPLGDFVAALPTMTVGRTVPQPVRRTIERIASEVRRVVFDPPLGFEEVRFWPIGIDGWNRWPFADERIQRMLVISPYLEERSVRRLSEQGVDHVLIARDEALGRLPSDALARFPRAFVLSDGADIEAQGVAEDVHPEEVVLLRGLHAKCYVADDGWKAHVWTGSANATDAAFGGNVEFLVQLTGKKSRCGVDAVLGQEKGVISFLDLLQPFAPGTVPVDEVLESLQHRADDVRYAVAKMRFAVRVKPEEAADTFTLRVESRSALPSWPDTSLRCWPIRFGKGSAVELVGKQVAEFSSLALEDISSFFAFEATVTTAGRSASARFVLNLPLLDAPPGRMDRILRSLLKNRDQLLRFLLFLLADTRDGSRNGSILPMLARPPGKENGSASGLHLPLFEVLVQTLYRDPSRLDHVARLVEDLRRTDEGAALLPESFESVWEPIWATRRRLK
jgi:hypothetical protein